MTDRELLELAAKAAGIVGEYYSHPEGDWGLWNRVCGGLSQGWNPLTDDGDALRLGVKLGIDVFPWQDKNHDKDDLYALARRAVRLYPRTTYTDRRAVNTLRRGWIRQITYLGDKWLLAVPVARKSQVLDIPL